MLRKRGGRRLPWQGRLRGGVLFLLLGWQVLGFACRQGKRAHRSLSGCRGGKRGLGWEALLGGRSPGSREGLCLWTEGETTCAGWSVAADRTAAQLQWGQMLLDDQDWDNGSMFLSGDMVFSWTLRRRQTHNSIRTGKDSEFHSFVDKVKGETKEWRNHNKQWVFKGPGPIPWPPGLVRCFSVLLYRWLSRASPSHSSCLREPGTKASCLLVDKVGFSQL